MKPQLQRDLALDELRSAARQRRGKRQALGAIFIIVPIFIFAKLMLFQPAVTLPAPTEQIVVTEPKEATPTSLYIPISSDEELLALLADQGPVLVSNPDGTKRLILTNPPAPLLSDTLQP